MKKIILLAKKLIAIPSYSENFSGKREIINFVVKEFQNERVFKKIICYKKNFSLLLMEKKKISPELALCGHLDVVSASKEEFIPKLKGERLYGRGAGDMKGAVAVMLEVFRNFLKKKLPLCLILTTDEEEGGFFGTKYLLEKKIIFPKKVIFPDGGGDLSKIVIAQKGVLQFELKVKGKSCHASRPWLGENALEKFFEILSELKKEFQNPKKRKWQNTLSLTKIRAGRAPNQIPSLCQSFFDLRYLPNEKEKDIFLKLKKIVGKKGKIKLRVKASPFYQDPKEKFIQQWKKVAQDCLKKKVKFVKYESASDARFYKEHKIPVLITQVKQGNIHSKNEWVDLRELEKFFEILKKFVKIYFEKG